MKLIVGPVLSEMRHIYGWGMVGEQALRGTVFEDNFLGASELQRLL